MDCRRSLISPLDLMVLLRARATRHWGTVRKKMSPGLGSTVHGRHKYVSHVYTVQCTTTTQYEYIIIILWVTTQTQLFLTQKKNPLAGEWPKLFRENNVEITRFVWCPPVFGKFSQRQRATQ